MNLLLLIIILGTTVVLTDHIQSIYIVYSRGAEYFTHSERQLRLTATEIDFTIVLCIVQIL